MASQGQLVLCVDCWFGLTKAITKVLHVTSGCFNVLTEGNLAKSLLKFIETSNKTFEIGKNRGNF